MTVPDIDRAMTFCSEEKEKAIKSQRAGELEALRMKGLAQERRTWLKDRKFTTSASDNSEIYSFGKTLTLLASSFSPEVVSSPLTTPEQAAEFLAVMKDKSKRHSVDPSQNTPTRPTAFLLADGVDSWFMQQRYRDKELRRRRQEAAQLLHGYKGYYPEKDGENDFGHWSPRNSLTPRGRASFGEVWSDKKTEHDKNRRQTSFARLETSGGNEGESRDDFLPHPLGPDRSQFLNERSLYDGTKYPKPADRHAYSEGVTMFTEQSIDETQETREIGTTYTPYRHMNVDTSDAQETSVNGEEREGAEATEEREQEDTLERESLESRRQRHYDGLFQPRSKNTIATARGDSVRGFLEGKVRKRIDEEHKRINDSKSRLAERLEMRFAENHRHKHSSASSVAMSVSTEDSPPPLPETVWRDFISDEPGAKFPPEAGRYHLYASYACPGSHRALMVRALKGLEDVISVTFVHPTWRHTNTEDPTDKHRGWVFGNPNGKPFRNTIGRGGPFPAAYPGNEPDPIFGANSVRELYEYAQDTSGKYTIPVLWDKKTNTIVNNESSDISYMFNSCLNNLADDPELDFYTEDNEEGLDKLNEVSQWLYPMMIHGVYRCGFAKTQEMYDNAIEQLTAAFDMAEEILSKQRYLTGDTMTDADLRLFVTLLRFDEVYAFYFKANTRLVMLSPSLLNFCREIYQMKGIAETCQMEQIKAHFYGSHAEWNKYSVIPRGLNFMKLLDQPHDRYRFKSSSNEGNTPRGGRSSF
eukprot:scaffold22612_cov138-Cylindrotheca_fusiformis.AAC.10